MLQTQHCPYVTRLVALMVHQRGSSWKVGGSILGDDTIFSMRTIEGGECDNVSEQSFSNDNLRVVRSADPQCVINMRGMHRGEIG